MSVLPPCGVSVSPGGRHMGPDTIPRLAAIAEEAGYDSVWFAEVAGPDAVSSMTTVLNTSTRLTVGTSVLPIYVRPPTLTAITFASLSRLGPGRVICGLGVSAPAIVEDWNGLELRKPITATREYVAMLRAIWSEDKITRDGEIYHVKNFRPGIQPPPEHPVPIYLAALNAPMLRLAGAIADGVKLNWLPASIVPTLIQDIRAGAEEAGRDPDEVKICANIRFAVTDDVEQAEKSLRREITGYAIVPYYRRLFERAGWTDECGALMEAWNAGKRREAPNAVSQSMREELIGIGGPAECQAFVQEYLDAGVQYPILMPIPFGERRQQVWEETTQALSA